MKKILILFSGGLESTSLIEYYKDNYNIYLLYIKFGYSWEDAEVSHAIKIATFNNLTMDIIDCSKIFNVTQLGFVNSAKENIIPLRNLSLLTFSALYANNKNIDTLTFGLQGSPEYPDTSLKYIKECEKLIKKGLNNNLFKIEIPFFGKDKEEIIKLTNPPLNLVFSCTNPIGFNRCNNCFKCLKLNKLIKKYN